MRTGRALLLLLVAVAALASAVPAAAREVRLEAGETVTLAGAGASAAFAVDAGVVEATAVGGDVVLVGRRAGHTLVTLVTADAVETLTVRVEAPAARAMATERAAAPRAGTLEGRYDSGTGRFSTGLTMAVGDGTRAAELRLYGIQESGGRHGRDVQAIPAASLTFTAPGRTLVLLDELVEASPLTLDGTVLRGLHLRQGGLALHAGIASATPWDDVLLPASGDRALGLSYRFERRGLRWAPAVLWLPDAEAAGGGAAELPGVVALGVGHGGEDDRLRLFGELGWSGEPGAAVDVAFRGERQHAWLQAASRPAGFAALGVARPAGGYLDGAWSGRLTARTTADATLSSSRLDLPGHRQEAASGRLELRHRLTGRFSLHGGVAGGRYRDRDRPASELDRTTLSLGGAWDARSAGVAGVYRWQDVSAAAGAGHGGRLTLRGARSGWRAHLFVDAQEQAPTLDLVLRDRPDLARAFAELGFAAGTPEEVLRLLRDNAPLLAEHGVVVGALELQPLRLQAGFDASWRRSRPRPTEVRLRLVADDAEGVAADRRAYLGTLSVSRRLFADTDLQLAYTRWSSERDGSTGRARDSLEVALRTGLSAPGPGGGGGRPITGWVLRDDQATGDPAAGLPPLAGVEVVLDGLRRTRTGDDGRFVFANPGGGEHHVEALLPAGPGAYFTLPSVAAVRPGGEARFAVTFAAALLSGKVSSDAGLPIAGVKLRLRGETEAVATTDTSGRYRFAVPAGDHEVALVADSVPPGYDLPQRRTEERYLEPGSPATADFTLRAQRAVSGTVTGAAGETLTVTAVEAGLTVDVAAAGRFALRGLPAGEVTLVVRGSRGESRRAIVVGAGPGIEPGVQLPAP